jgi:putative iron-dependent peroxidase
MRAQAGILAPLPRAARYLTYHVRPGADPRDALRRLSARCDGESVVVGLGASLVAELSGTIEGLRPFPSLSGPGFDVPATPASLWCWLRDDDRGELVHATRDVDDAIHGAFDLGGCIDAFMFRDGRDLTGYVDGTENPTGERARDVAIRRGAGPGLDGSSFVAVQQWRHDLDAFAELKPSQQDATFGRRLSDNEEIDDAPPSAHVKRTAQESFDPPAFVVRRSMPWADADGEGLVFVAFGASLDPFEALLRRMTGQEDGLPDALFQFTHPVTGAYFWCPPIAGEGLDLRALGL